MFTKRSTDGSLSGLLAVHVDDILFTGSKLFLAETEKILRTFRAGETECLTPKTPIIFLGLLIEMRDTGVITLSQTRYEKDLPKLDPALYIKAGKVIDGKEFRTTMRQALGALIWLHQTRPDVGFDITKIATDAVPARGNGDLAWKLILLYNKTIRYIKNFPGRYITFHQIPRNDD